MAFSYSTASAFWLANSGGTLVNITSYVDSVSVNETSTSAEVTTLADSAVKRVVGIKDLSLDISGPYDPTIGSYIQTALNAKRAFKWFPQGSVASNDLLQGTIILEDFTTEGPGQDAVKWSASGVGDGGGTWSTV